ncbi:MAG: O-antigen ligase family protein [Thermoanaerobaculia bacterium]
MAALRPHLPALLLALFAFHCGTLPGAAEFPAVAIGQALLLVAATLAGARIDPLRLGRAGRLLPWALLLTVIASRAASPVPRAGIVALALLPAFLLLPSFVADCWATARARAAGVRSLLLLVGAVSVWSLVERARDGSERAAMPLGHHNLLAAFLVILLPLCVPGLRDRGPVRWLTLATIIAGGGALFATRSFLAAGVLATVALLFSARFARARQAVCGLALLALALLVPRAIAIVSGGDSSGQARAVYWRAAWDGFLERPITGWGPGSTPWTIAETMRPRPGISPAGEIVGQSHSLPLELLRELGAPGLALVVACLALFVIRRLWAPSGATDQVWVEAGVASLFAALGSSLGEAWLSVPAIPLAMAVGIGAALAGEREGPEAGGGASRWPAVLYAAAAAVLLVPPLLAERSYDRAVRAGTRDPAAAELADARRLDPRFPLYRARWAWSASAAISERAAEAFRAADESRGVATLWLRAGALALEAGTPDPARLAFSRALALDPLSAFAPFQLAALVDDPAACAARAVLAEPRLLAASVLRDREGRREALLRRIESWPGIDAGWRSELLQRASGLPEAGGDEVDLAARIDSEPALAMSLLTFRRRPWKADVARIRLEREGVRALRDLVPATALATSAATAFPRDRCAP